MAFEVLIVLLSAQVCSSSAERPARGHVEVQLLSRWNICPSVQSAALGVAVLPRRCDASTTFVTLLVLQGVECSLGKRMIFLFCCLDCGQPSTELTTLLPSSQSVSVVFFLCKA